MNDFINWLLGALCGACVTSMIGDYRRGKAAAAKAWRELERDRDRCGRRP